MKTHPDDLLTLFSERISSIEALLIF